MPNDIVLSVQTQSFSWEGLKVASFQVHPQTIRACVKQTLRNLKRLKAWDAQAKAKTAKYNKITIHDDTVVFTATALTSVMVDNLIARYEGILATI